MFFFVAQECKKAWANLRDAYRRAIKKSATVSGQKAKIFKKWKYESEMEFLKPYMKERETVSSVDTKSDVEESSSDSENEINKSSNITVDSINSPEENITNSTPSELSPKFSKPQPKKIMTPKKRKKNEGHASSESASSHLMRYIIEKEKKEEIKANTEKNEIDVIDQFFQNMGSTVKQFSPYHQHLAKTRVFSVISELELDHINSQKLHEQQYRQKDQQQNISALQPIFHSPQDTDGSISHHSDSETSSNLGNFLTTFIP